MLRTIYPDYIEGLPESPNEILEDTAMAALTSSLSQLSKLSRYANQIFDELLVDSKQSFAHMNSIGKRVEALKTKIPVVSFSAVSGREYRPAIREVDNIFVHQPGGDGLPTPILSKYQSTLLPPALEKFDSMIGGESSLKKFTNPQFFTEQWILAMQEQHKKNEADMIKRKEARRRNRKKKTTDVDEKKGKKKVAAVKKKKYSAFGAEFADDTDMPSVAPTVREPTASPFLNPATLAQSTATVSPVKPVQVQPAAVKPVQAQQPVLVKPTQPVVTPPTVTQPTVTAPTATPRSVTPPRVLATAVIEEAPSAAIVGASAAVRRGGPPPPSVDTNIIAPSTPSQSMQVPVESSGAAKPAVRRGGPPPPPAPEVDLDEAPAPKPAGAVKRGGPPPAPVDLDFSGPVKASAPVTPKTPATSPSDRSSTASSGGHGALMDAIRGGPRLKSAAAQAPLAEKPAPVASQHSELLMSIQKGVSLKKAADRVVKEVKKPEAKGPMSVAEILAKTIRPAMHYDDSDSEDDDDWD